MKPKTKRKTILKKRINKDKQIEKIVRLANQFNEEFYKGDKIKADKIEKKMKKIMFE